MAKNGEQRPVGIPPLKNVQWLNTPVNVGPRDGDGVREISFITSSVEQQTFVLAPGAQVDIARILIEELTNDEKQELLGALAPGLEVATTVPQS